MSEWTKEEKASGALLITKIINGCADMPAISQILHVANELACQRNALLEAITHTLPYIEYKCKDSPVWANIEAELNAAIARTKGKL